MLGTKALSQIYNIVNDDSLRECETAGSFQTIKNSVDDLVKFLDVDNNYSSLSTTNFLEDKFKTLLLASRNNFDSDELLLTKFAILNQTSLQNVTVRTGELKLRAAFQQFNDINNLIIPRKPGNERCVEALKMIKQIITDELKFFTDNYTVIDERVGIEGAVFNSMLNEAAFNWALQIRMNMSDRIIQPIAVSGSKTFNIRCDDMQKYSLRPIDIFNRITVNASIPYAKCNDTKVMTSVYRNITKISIACPDGTLTSKKNHAFFSVTDVENPVVRSQYALIRSTHDGVIVRLNETSERVYDIFSQASGITIDTNNVTDVSNTYLYPEVAINKSIFFAMVRLSPYVAPLIYHRDTGNTINAPARYYFRFTPASIKLQTVTSDSVEIEITSGNTETNNDLSRVMGYILGHYSDYAKGDELVKFFKDDPSFGVLSSRRNLGSRENENKVEKLKALLGLKTISPIYASEVCQCERQPIAFNKSNFSPEFIRELGTTFKREDGVSYSLTMNEGSNIVYGCVSKTPFIRYREITAGQPLAPCCSAKEVVDVIPARIDTRPLLCSYPFSRHPPVATSMDATLYGIYCKTAPNPSRTDINILIREYTRIRPHNAVVYPEYCKVDMPDNLTVEKIGELLTTAVPDVLLMKKYLEYKFNINIYIVETQGPEIEHLFTFTRPLNMIHHHREWRNRPCIVVKRSIVNTPVPVQHEMVSIYDNFLMSKDMDRRLHAVYMSEVCSSKIDNGVIVKYQNNVMRRLGTPTSVIQDNYGYARILFYTDFTVYTDPIDPPNVPIATEWQDSTINADSRGIAERLGKPSHKNDSGLWYGNSTFIWGKYTENNLPFRQPPHEYRPNTIAVIPNINKLKEFSKYMAWIINRYPDSPDKVGRVMDDWYIIVDDESEIPDVFYHRETMPQTIDGLVDALNYSWPGLMDEENDWRIKITEGMMIKLSRYMNSMLNTSSFRTINLNTFNVTIVDRNAIGAVRFSTLFAYSDWFARVSGVGSNKVMNSTSTFNVAYAGQDYSHPFLSTVTIGRRGYPCLVQRVFNNDRETAIAVSLSWLKEKVNPGIYSSIQIPAGRMSLANFVSLNETDNIVYVSFGKDRRFKFNRPTILRLNDEAYVAILMLVNDE